ncbi:unannotated protein [freshwater metagenome]|uniref:Unannotated protein n=1 Tax=freshwater metagenome TaxID=449393 RepID=A0A6J7RLD2_9ZZZZ
MKLRAFAEAANYFRGLPKYFVWLVAYPLCH